MKTNLLILAMLLFSFFSIGQDDFVGKKDSSKVEIYEYVEEFAEFPGGPEALKKYLAENLNYPENAVNKNIEGTVYLRFIVSKSGYITNVRVVKAIPDCDECSEEVIRVYSSMPNWKPAKYKGEIVDSYFNSKVTFKIPKPEIKQ
jgi:periplasmic protein TonB